MARRPRNAPDEPTRTRTAMSVSDVLTSAPSRYSGEDEEEGATDIGQAPGAPMTQYATRSALVAEAVQSDLENKRYGKQPPRGVRVSEPDGPSTDGGLKARQSILLTPVLGQGTSFHCGWMDAAKMTAQLKSWDAIVRKHRARFGEEPDLLRGAYEAFLVDVRRVLIGHGIDVQLVVPDEELPAAAAQSAEVGVRTGVVVALTAIAFALGLLLGAIIG